MHNIDILSQRSIRWLIFSFICSIECWPHVNAQTVTCQNYFAILITIIIWCFTDLIAWNSLVIIQEAVSSRRLAVIVIILVVKEHYNKDCFDINIPIRKTSKSGAYLNIQIIYVDIYCVAYQGDKIIISDNTQRGFIIMILYMQTLFSAINYNKHSIH